MNVSSKDKSGLGMLDDKINDYTVMNGEAKLFPPSFYISIVHIFICEFTHSNKRSVGSDVIAQKH